MKMKKTFVILLSLAAACGESGTEPEDPEIVRETPRGFTVQEGRLAQASVGFGLKLYQEIAGAENKTNLLVSPLSVSMALGMTMNGAEAATYDAMRSSLGFGTLTESEINEAYKGLIAQLLARDKKVEFNLANSVWYANGFQVKQPFLDAAKSYFDAEVRGLNFSDPASPRTISSWAENETGGRIKDLIKSIDPNEIMFLVNAVYFKAPWTTPFDVNATRSGTFTRENGSTVQTPLMTRDGQFRFYQNTEVMAAELLYGDTAFSMVLLAPATGRSLTPLVNKLTTSWWYSTMDSLRAGRLMLTIPKFKFEYEKRLNDALTGTGMGVIFDWQRADFDRIGDRDDIYITRVEHKTFIDVHELGTEAAAATAVGVGVVSMPPTMVFDRPFLFVIRERSSGTILFIGKIGDPTVSK